LPQVVDVLRPYLTGWRNNFAFCQTPRLLTHLEAWIRRRLRMYLWRQWQHGSNRLKELRRRGVPKFLAAVTAGSPTGFWRMSGHPAVQKAVRNQVFDALGLPRLYIAVSAPASACPQFRCRLRNSRILRLASVAASSLYSAQRPNMVLPGWSSG
jgi:RNA-directed DNA polymerase